MLCAAIFIVSSQPLAFPEAIQFFGFDKVAHFSAFYLLGFLLYVGFIKTGSAHPLLYSYVIGALYGISDELHQSTVPMRQCSAGDFAADCIGLLAFMTIRYMLQRKKSITVLLP